MLEFITSQLTIEQLEDKDGVLDRFLGNGVIVTTLKLGEVDGKEVFETGIMDKADIMPVERYSTEADALLGHTKWVEDSEDLEYVNHLPPIILDEDDEDDRRQTLNLLENENEFFGLKQLHRNERYFKK